MTILSVVSRWFSFYTNSETHFKNGLEAIAEELEEGHNDCSLLAFEVEEEDEGQLEIEILRPVEDNHSQIQWVPTSSFSLFARVNRLANIQLQKAEKARLKSTQSLCNLSEYLKEVETDLNSTWSEKDEHASLNALWTRVLSEEIGDLPAPFDSIPEFPEVFPSAWLQESEICGTHVKKCYYLDDAELVASKTGDEVLVYLDGLWLPFPEQTLKDLIRTRENSMVTLANEAVDLKMSEQEREIIFEQRTVCVSSEVQKIMGGDPRQATYSGEVAILSKRMKQILEACWEECGKDIRRFNKFTRLFNQTSQNLMAGDLLVHVMANHQFGLGWDQGMKRSFFLFSDDTARKFMTIIEGVSIHGTDPESIERKTDHDNPFASFKGVTIVNLDNNSAVVKLHMELHPDIVNPKKDF